MNSRFCQAYRILVLGMFLLLLAGTISFGRWFSLLRLFEFGGLPFYMTDAFIFLALPLAVVGMIALKKTPKAFYWPFLALFVMGGVYLTWGVVVDRSGFAFRGVVLSTYLLFLPLVWILFTSGIRFDRFLSILIFCNVVGILVGMGIGAGVWQSDMRGFNLTLYYAMAFSFLFAYGLGFVKRAWQWSVWFLAAVNVYMIVILGVRSTWVALVCLMVFYVFIFRTRIKDLVWAVCVIALFLGAIVFIKSSQGVGEEKPFYARRMEGTMLFWDKAVIPKVRSMGVGQARVVMPQQSLEGVPLESSMAYNNIIWRLKVWKATWRVGMASPVLGDGFSRVLVYDDSIAIDRVRGFADNSGITPPHNEFLTIFYKMGFLGLALFLWINGFVFVQGVKALRLCEQGMRRVCLIGALGGLVVWHAMAQFFDVIDSPPTNIFLWMLLGLVLVLVYGQKERSVQEAT
jgi:hypothetical protein